MTAHPFEWPRPDEVATVPRPDEIIAGQTLWGLPIVIKDDEPR